MPPQLKKKLGFGSKLKKTKTSLIKKKDTHIKKLNLQKSYFLVIFLNV